MTKKRNDGNDAKEENNMKPSHLAVLALGLIVVGLTGIYVTYISHPQTTSYSAEAQSLPDIVDRVIGNVVHVRNNTGRWQGSGVLVAPDLILTARHVNEGGDDFTVTTDDGSEWQASRAISSKKYDLGFIKLDPNDTMPVCTTVVGGIAECRLGESLFAIGSPYGEINFNSVTAGILSALDRNHDDSVPEYGWSATFQTDTPGHPGNSGCPVYTMDGKVRGILVGGMSNAVIYCVPAELVTNDCQVIQLMFLMDQYLKEVRPEYPMTTYSLIESITQ